VWSMCFDYRMRRIKSKMLQSAQDATQMFQLLDSDGCSCLSALCWCECIWFCDDIVVYTRYSDRWKMGKHEEIMTGESDRRGKSGSKGDGSRLVQIGRLAAAY
jgi:hypothetical protein